jgi:uncharacterized protein YkwD
MSAPAREILIMRQVAAVACVLLCLAVAGCASSLGINGTTENTSSVTAFRVSNGRLPVASDAHLASLAKGHAEDMARRESLDHNGFMETRGPAGARAENVSYGCADSPCAIRQWANSSGHRKNMLLADVTRYGLASAVSKSGRRYWAMELGE